MTRKPQHAYKATDIARWCGVDSATIHKWVRQGKLTCFRTPGRHIRVTSDNARTFLESLGVSLPAELKQ